MVEGMTVGLHVLRDSTARQEAEEGSVLLFTIQTLRTNWGPTRTILIPSDSRAPKNPIHLYHSPSLNGSTTYHIAIQGTKPPTQELLGEKPRVVSDGSGPFIKGCPEATWK